MSRSVILLFILIFAAYAVFPQSKQAGPAPTPTPTPQEEEDVVKISTNLVQVDVTVTDRSGRVIRDLRPEEIEVYQNGKKQQLSNFSFISAENTTTETAVVKAEPSVPVPAGPIKAENVKRTIAIVVDDLNMSFESIYYARRALKKFVDEQMREGDLIAIIRTGAGIGALQQFSNDKRQLYAAIERISWNPAGNGKVGAFAPLEAKNDMGDPEATAAMEEAQKDFDDFRTSVFATGTLGAVNYVVRGMAELPGRKSIMLVSEGFKLFEDHDGFMESGRVMDSLRFLVDRANRASVVIYAVDPRGLVYTGLTAADDTSGRTVDELNAEQRSRSEQLSDTQDGLVYLTRETGGFAVINNNDLSKGIRKVLDDQSYYLVGYVPDDDTFDPKLDKYNKLVVKVLRKGAVVRYRRGFFGVEKKDAALASRSDNERMVEALTSPFAVNDITLRLNTLFGYDAKAGAYVRTLLHVDGGDLQLTDAPDGGKKATFDVVALTFGDNGALIDQLSRTYTLTLQKDALERFTKNGFVYNFAVPIKKPGAYQFRVALRDHGSDHIGSANQFIEIPNLKKKRLTLSGVALENLTPDQYKNTVSGVTPTEKTDPLGDTAERKFKRGTILNYGFSIYNFRSAQGTASKLTTQVRIFRDGKLLFEGRQLPVARSTPASGPGISVAGSLNLGTEMAPGDYIMQILVTDDLAKSKQNTASQFVQFEVTE